MSKLRISVAFSLLIALMISALFLIISYKNSEKNKDNGFKVESISSEQVKDQKDNPLNNHTDISGFPLFDEFYTASNGKLYFRTGGSGSCPPIFKKAYLEDNNVKLEFSSSQEICTADYRIYDFVISLAGKTLDRNNPLYVSKNSSEYISIKYLSEIVS